MSEKGFACAINCMDGRVQLPVIQFVRQLSGAEYVDMVTEPGPVRILSEGKPEETEQIKKRVAISVQKHQSRLVAVVAHYDCAGNSVDKSHQLTQINRAIEQIKNWGFPVEVIGLWVDENWQVSLI